MALPHIIFLDAVGTLFEVQGSVGHIYSQFATEYGIEASEQSINHSFILAFNASPDPAFGAIASAVERAHLEKEWWRRVVLNTFTPLLDSQTFNGFDEFFELVYDYFSTASAWVLYPDVRPTLKRWTEQGLQLGVISNFDSRLLNVLRSLELDHFFQSITLSSEAGVAKPHGGIFALALAQHSAVAQDAIHIGDQYLDDYQGATQAGLMGVWLNREKCDNELVDVSRVIHSLDQLQITCS